MATGKLLNTKLLVLSLAAISLLTGCAITPKIGNELPRRGDEIVAAGRFFHTGTPVVLWMDPGGYDAYRVERRFSPIEKADWEASQAEAKDLHSPNRYNTRKAGLTPEEREKVRGGGWDLPLLQRVVNQFVIHYDVDGTSRNCFKTLHDVRGLSVQFMLDVDGTIYQTLDVKERAWHAGIANDRSVGVEIANIGAYGTNEANPFTNWYTTGPDGITRLKLPPDSGVRTPNFQGEPARPQPIQGEIQGRELVQYDFTPQQYNALTKLTAALCNVFPRIECKYPKDAEGKLITHKLSDTDLKNYHGVLGHYHISTDKVDPGPAFQWDRVIGGARKILGLEVALPPRWRDSQ